MQNERHIIHIDMNAYFASVEQRANPHLSGKPVIVTGEGRSVVVTASYEARAYGVKTGMNVYTAKGLCPRAVVVFADFDKYTSTALEIHKILLKYTDLVEVFSIDECFMDVTGSIKIFGSPVEIALSIKDELKRRLGLTCSIGIAPNKLLAKLASDMQKPDGLVVIKQEDVQRLLDELPVEELCGIGEKMAQHLRGLGIRRAGELGRANIDMLVNYFGFWGYHLKRMGMGIDNSPVKRYDEKEGVKSIGHSYTFYFDTLDMEIILSYLRILCEMVGRRLRRYGMVGRTLALTLRYADFSTLTKRSTSGGTLYNGWQIYERAKGVLNGFLPLKDKVRLLGVSVSSLVENPCQGSLFDDMEKRNRLAEAMDRINEKFGEWTIKPLSVMIAEQYGHSRHAIPPRMHR
jgi:DNA polymerase-4